MKKLKLQPLGKIDASLLDSLAALLAKRFGFQVYIQQPLPIPIYAFNPRRRQFHTPTILRRLRRAKLAEDEGILGVTNVDMYVPGLNFVFGQAEIKGKAAAISLFRLRPEFYKQDISGGENKALYLKRAGKEAVHEIGHVLSLKHCPDETCVMHFSSSISDTDKKSDSLCLEHQSQLLKG